LAAQEGLWLIRGLLLKSEISSLGLQGLNLNKASSKRVDS